MKSFFSLFVESFKSLKQLRTLTTTGMLLAMAVAIRTLSIDVTADLRISFTFIPITAIAMLYGPVVCGASTFILDFLGYLITNKSARFYSPQLAAVVILSGIIYGALLYKCDFKKERIKGYVMITLACLIVAVVCNSLLNTYFLYTLYVNKDFSPFHDGDMHAFGVYMLPRVVKNLIEFPIRSVILCFVLPAVKLAYDKVQAQFRKNKAE
ncbi:MAG: folate family ECF transporter S component [Ruminococcus sp.]|nr:folate family ECF transporter S component [Ruminococcus sp.]